MPWTLYRYILSELVKLIALATAILITLISFAAAGRPLTEGLLGPGTLVKFVLYTMPTMLGFALPFAGAFAATLVFIRMAGDNEILAASASGISYRGILAPVFGLGVVLTAGLFVLSNFVVPSFYQKAKATVQADLITVMVTQLNQGKPFDEIDGAVVYADSAREMAKAPHIKGAKVQPSKVVRLQGAAVAQLDDDNRIQAEGLAREANLALFNDPQTHQSWIRIFLRDWMFYDQANGQLLTARAQWTKPFPMDQGLGEQPEFMSYFELRDLGRHPARYDRVRERMSGLGDALAQRRLRLLLRKNLADGGTAELAGRVDSDRYRLRVPRLTPTDEGFELSSAGGRPVQIGYRRDGQLVQRLEADAGTLRLDPSQNTDEPSVLIELSGVKAYDTTHPGPATTRNTQQLRRLYWPKPIFAGVVAQGQPGGPGDLTLDQLRRLAAAPGYRQGKTVQRAARRVGDAMKRLEREILAQLHQRAASAVSCCLLLLLGASLSIWLRDHMTLVVYAVSFVLAIVTLILISTGGNLATSADNSLAVGLGVMWLGNVLLALVCVGVYWAFARN